MSGETTRRPEMATCAVCGKELNHTKVKTFTFYCTDCGMNQARTELRIPISRPQGGEQPANSDTDAVHAISEPSTKPDKQSLTMQRPCECGQCQDCEIADAYMLGRASGRKAERALIEPVLNTVRHFLRFPTVDHLDHLREALIQYEQTRLDAQ